MFPSEQLLTRFEGVTDTLSVTDETLCSFVEIIRAGSFKNGRGIPQRFRKKIVLLRECLHSGELKVYQSEKKKLLGVTLAGVFREGRHDADLTDYSGLVHVDLDKLTPEQVQEYREILQKDPFVLVVFVSASGRGLKVIGWHPLGAEHHESVYWAFRRHVQQLLQCPEEVLDDSVRNLARLCFVSHDPDAYLNLKASPMVSAVSELGEPTLEPVTSDPTPPTAEEIPAKPKSKSLFDASKHTIFDDGTNPQKYGAAVLDANCEKIRAAPDGQKHQTRLLRARVVAGYVAGGYIEEAVALQRLISAALDNTEDPRLAEKDIRDGFEHGKQEPLEVPDPDPQFLSGGLQVRQADLGMDEKLSRLREIVGDAVKDSDSDSDSPRKNPLLSFDDFVADLRPPDFLVKDMIERNSLVTLIGEPGVGKSFLALSWGLAVATGLDWQEKTVKQGGVYYLAGEGSAGMRRRMMAWYARHRVNPKQAFRVLPGGWTLTKAEEVQRLYEQMAEVVQLDGVPPSLIVVDTLARHFGAENENDTQSMNAFVSYLDLIRQEFDCTILVVHHTGKDKEKGGRGSSVLHGAVDASYLLEKAESGTMTLKCLKMKDADLPGHQHYQLMSVQVEKPDGRLLVQDDGHTPVTSAVLIPAEAEEGAEEDVVILPRKKGPKDSEKLAYEAFMELWEIGKQNLLSSGRTLEDLTVSTEQWSQLCQSEKYGLKRFTVSDIKQNKREMYGHFHSEVMVIGRHLMKKKLDDVGQ